jgi:hypothetical protein
MAIRDGRSDSQSLFGFGSARFEAVTKDVTGSLNAWMRDGPEMNESVFRVFAVGLEQKNQQA